MTGMDPSMDEKIWGTQAHQTISRDETEVSQSDDATKDSNIKNEHVANAGSGSSPDAAIEESSGISKEEQQNGGQGPTSTELSLFGSPSRNPILSTSSPGNAVFGSVSATGFGSFGLLNNTGSETAGPSAATFGSSNAIPFGGGSSSAFGSSTTPRFGSSTTPAFGSSTTPAFGSSTTPAFGSSNTPAFGSGTTPLFGSGNTPLFNYGNTPAFGFGNASTFNSANSTGLNSKTSSKPAFRYGTRTGFGKDTKVGDSIPQWKVESPNNAAAASLNSKGVIEEHLDHKEPFTGGFTKDAGTKVEPTLPPRTKRFLAERAALKERSEKSKHEVKAELQKLIEQFDEFSSNDIHSAMTKLEANSAKLQAKLQKPTYTFAHRRAFRVVSLQRRTQQLESSNVATQPKCESKPAPHKSTITEMIFEDDEWKDPGDVAFKYFLRLPFELRELIFEHAMVDLCPNFIVRPTMTLSTMVLYPHTLPQFCFVSRQWREEAILVWLRRTRLIVYNETPAINKIKWFLIQFTDGQGYKAVRRLSFVTRMQRYREKFITVKGPHTLVSLCSSITHLVFEIDGIDMVEIHSSPGKILSTTYVRRTAEELETLFQFSPLFELKNLKNIKLYCSGWKYKVNAEQITTPEAVFEVLVGLLRDGFAQMDRTVEVEAVILPDD